MQMMKLQRGFPDFDLDGKEIYLDRVRCICFSFGSRERDVTFFSSFFRSLCLSTSSSLPFFLPLSPIQLDGLAERMRIFVTRMRLSGDAQAKEWLHLVRRGGEVFYLFFTFFVPSSLTSNAPPQKTNAKRTQ